MSFYSARSPYNSAAKALTSKGGSSPGSPGKPVNSYTTAANSTITRIINRIGASQNTTNSQIVQEKLAKLIKAEKRSMKLQEEIITAVNFWGDNIAEEDSKVILHGLSCFLEGERAMKEEQVHKQENVKLQLLNVQKRESKSRDLKFRRDKLFNSLRDQESKQGQSSSTTLIKEHLEEADSSLSVVHEQYIRSIKNQLKLSIADYMITLSTAAKRLNTEASQLFDVIASIPTPISKSGQTYQMESDGDMILHNLQLKRFINSAAAQHSGSAKGSSRSITPVSMNPLNQPNSNEIPASNSYLNILKTQLQQRHRRNSNEENGSHVHVKGTEATCNACQHAEVYCSRHRPMEHQHEQLEHRAKSSSSQAHPHPSSVFNKTKPQVYPDEAYEDESGLRGRQSGTHVPGGMGFGFRFPSGLAASQEHWKR